MKLFFSMIILLSTVTTVCAQEVTLFEQFNGRFDYLAFGNTLNVQENGANDPCDILTESSADFSLDADQTIVVAYLYWAGSLSPGDFEVNLNSVPVTASRQFDLTFTSNGVDYSFFAAFADVTSILEDQGNGEYTVSNLDLTSNIDFYCNGNSTNFGGWAVTVIYEDPDLTLQNVSVFDGLQSVNATQNDLTIVLDNLNVIDAQGAKIGFVAWEGDAGLAIDETLSINGNLISNPPLNPANNAFNGTNSFTNASDLFNMDLDVYEIENNINPGDTQVTIDLTSGQDFVMINNIITVLNTEIPDATIAIDTIDGGTVCGDRDLNISYTIFNSNSTDVLPANTPISFFANETLVGQTATVNDIAINGEESGMILLSIPETIPAEFTLTARVDDTGDGTGIVDEGNENNNEASTVFRLLIQPEVNTTNLQICDAIGIESFDLTSAVTTDTIDNLVTFHLTEIDAQNGNNEILNAEIFQNSQNPQTIYVRVDNGDCFVVASFTIEVIICPLPDATVVIVEDTNPCRGRLLDVNFIVFNNNATDVLPAATTITFYADDVEVGSTITQNPIEIDQSESGSISLNLPDSLPTQFTLTAIVDQADAVEELDETNNEFETLITFDIIPPITPLPDLIVCDEGFNTSIFNLREYDQLIQSQTIGQVQFFENQNLAQLNINPILDPEQYTNISDPQTIYVRLENDICFTTTSFVLRTENCAPYVPQGFSPNNDTINDVFEISRLLNIFEDFNLQIFNRYGAKLYEGGNALGFWDGFPNTGVLYKDALVPVGTYYYVLHLNDENFPEPLTGFVYVNY